MRIISWSEWVRRVSRATHQTTPDVQHCLPAILSAVTVLTCSPYLGILHQDTPTPTKPGIKTISNRSGILQEAGQWKIWKYFVKYEVASSLNRLTYHKYLKLWKIHQLMLTGINFKILLEFCINKCDSQRINNCRL